MVSPDTVFSKIGAVSRINYHSRFLAYKKIITTMAHTEDMESLFEYWNSIVFSHCLNGSANGEDGKEAKGGESDGGEADEMEELMNELKLGPKRIPAPTPDDVLDELTASEGENPAANAPSGKTYN